MSFLCFLCFFFVFFICRFSHFNTSASTYFIPVICKHFKFSFELYFSQQNWFYIVYLITATLDGSGRAFVHFLFYLQGGPGFRSQLGTWVSWPTLSRGISPARRSPPRHRPWRSVRTPSTAAPYWYLQTPPANQRPASHRAPPQTAAAAPRWAPWCRKGERDHRVRVQTDRCY